MKQAITLFILAILSVPVVAYADVGFSVVNKGNQKEASGDIYVVTQEKSPEGAFGFAITIRPPQKWQVTRADVRFSASGKTSSTAPLRLFPQQDGSTRIEFVVAEDMREMSQVDVLLDSVDPEAPNVGHLHRIELNSYLKL